MKTISDFVVRKHQRSEFNATSTLSAGAYSTGQVFGGLITIGKSAGVQGPIDEHSLSAILQSITAYDPSGESPSLDLFFFNKKPTATYTDQAAFDASEADLQNCIGIVKINATDWTASATKGSVAGGVNQSNLGRVMKPAGPAQASSNYSGNTDLYCVPVIRSTGTFNRQSIYYKFQFSHGL